MLPFHHDKRACNVQDLIKQIWKTSELKLRFKTSRMVLVPCGLGSGDTDSLKPFTPHQHLASSHVSILWTSFKFLKCINKTYLWKHQPQGWNIAGKTWHWQLQKHQPQGWNIAGKTWHWQLEKDQPQGWNTGWQTRGRPWRRWWVSNWF